MGFYNIYALHKKSEIKILVSFKCTLGAFALIFIDQRQKAVPEDFLTLKVLPPKTEVGQALRKVPAIKKEMVGERKQREREGGNSKHTTIVLRYLPSISTILPTLMYLCCQ